MNRNRVASLCVAVACLLATEKSRAQAVSTTASVQASCGSEPSSNKTPQVTLRWGYPNYDDNDFLNWKVPCDGQNHSQLVALTRRKSQLEVQTEGGVETHYSLEAKIKAVGKEGDSFLQLDHRGTPTANFNNPRISVTRSSGPNQYGEQNFRVAIPDGTTPHVKIQMSAVNLVENGQVALRWGHTDFNDTSDFKSPNPKIWTVKSKKVMPHSSQAY